MAWWKFPLLCNLCLVLELNDLIHAPKIGFELNQALEEDLGGIEDLIQAADNLQDVQALLAEPEDIIDAGTSRNSSFHDISHDVLKLCR